MLCLLQCSAGAVTYLYWSLWWVNSPTFSSSSRFKPSNLASRPLRGSDRRWRYLGSVHSRSWCFAVAARSAFTLESRFSMVALDSCTQAHKSER